MGKKAIPCYDELFKVAVESIPFPLDQKLKVLDLGAGTGLFSWHVFKRYRNAHFTLMDLADKMLDMARERFSNHDTEFSYLKYDYRNLKIDSELDLVISSLSIHHLDDEEKQDLFNKIFEILLTCGVFFNVDQITFCCGDGRK